MYKDPHITYKPKHPFYNFKPSACGKPGWEAGVFGSGYNNAIPCIEEYKIVKKLVNFHTSNPGKKEEILTPEEIDLIENIITNFFNTSSDVTIVTSMDIVKDGLDLGKKNEYHYDKYLTGEFGKQRPHTKNEDYHKHYLKLVWDGGCWADCLHDRPAREARALKEKLAEKLKLQQQDSIKNDNNTISIEHAERIGNMACWVWINNYYAPADGYKHRRYEFLSGHQFKPNDYYDIKEKPPADMYHETVYKVQQWDVKTRTWGKWPEEFEGPDYHEITKKPKALWFYDMRLALNKWMLGKGNPFDNPPTRNYQGYDWDRKEQTWERTWWGAITGGAEAAKKEKELSDIEKKEAEKNKIKK